MFAFSANRDGITAGWQTLGSWTVPLVAPPPVSPVVTVSPANGAGSGNQFEVRVSDLSGRASIQQSDLVFGSLEAGPSCWIEYWVPSKTLFLRSDNGSQWYSAAVGSAVVLHNSLCSFDVRSALVSGSGSALTLTLPISFSASAAGTNLGIRTFASEANGKSSGWQSAGSWTVK